MDDMEVILVDDGSPDRSGTICDQWAASDPWASTAGHARVVHRPNGGLSAARNSGIEIAKGDYITFVDSDDWVEADTYGPLIERLAKHPDWDILEYPVYRFYGAPRQSMLRLPEEEHHNMRRYWLTAQAYTHCYACNKIFRRELFDEVSFPEGLLFEDTWTLPRLLGKARCVATTDCGLYYYCANPTGITSTADGQAMKSLLEAQLCAMQMFNLDASADSDIYYMHIVNIQIVVSELTGEKPLLPCRRVKHTDRLSGVSKVKAYINNILGLNTLCKIFKAIHQLRKLHS